MPFYGTAGCTDAKLVDYQAVMESTMNSFTSLTSCANIVHDIGIMDHCTTLSPELAVVTNEIISMLNVVRKGIRVDTEALAFDVIKKVGPAGHYLMEDHTMRHFRDFWYSDLLDRSTENDNPFKVDNLFNEKTRDIISNHKTAPIADDKLKVLNELREKWEKGLSEY